MTRDGSENKKKLGKVMNRVFEKVNTTLENMVRSQYKGAKWGPTVVLVVALLAVILSVRYIDEVSQFFGKAADDGVDLAMVASKTSVSEGENVYIDIHLTNTSPTIVAAVEMEITYDPSLFSAVSLVNKGLFPTELIPAKLSTPGLASMTLGSDPGNPVVSDGVVATLVLRANASSGTGRVEFGPGTKLSAVGQIDNFVRNMNGVEVSIGVTSSSPSPAASPTPDPEACGTCFKNVCDGVCHKKDAETCPDCFVDGSPDPSPTPEPTSDPACSECFKSVCDGICRPNDGSACPDCL